jgi:hypothetical protein
MVDFRPSRLELEAKFIMLGLRGGEIEGMKESQVMPTI